MPEYGFNYNLGPQTKPMTIADMLNLAGGAQQLQQSMQMNPLQVQQAQQQLRQQQLATQKAEALTPEEIQTGIVTQQETRKRQPIETAEKQLGYTKKNAEFGMQLMGGLAQDSRIQNAAQDPKGAIDALIQGGKLMQAGGIDEKVATALFAPLLAVAQNEPQKLPQVMKNLISAGTSPEAQMGRATPQLTTTAGAPALFTSGTGELTQPKIQGQPATQGEPAFPEPSAAQPAQGQPTQGNMPAMPYPVRKAGDIRPVAPSELADLQAGQAYKNKLVQRQSEITTAKRNLDEVVKEATGLKESNWPSSGVLGAVVRNFRNWAGDPTYKQLSKDLANVQISNIQAMGGSLDTVAGQQLTRMASGDETYPPEVLIQIARRAYADLQDLEMRGVAAQKFSQKFGDANMNVFKQLWQENSDSKLFEAISIDKSKMSPEAKKTEYASLFKGLSKEDLQKLAKKKANLQTLMANGSL